MKSAEDYYRTLERLSEASPHLVYVIQDKRALHDEARRHGIEFMVGGEPDENRRCPVCGEPPTKIKCRCRFLHCKNEHSWDPKKMTSHSGGPGQTTESGRLIVTKSQDDEPTSPESDDYVSKFKELTSKAPKSFSSWVKSETKKMGEKMLADGGVDEYDVADAGVYSHLLTAKEPIIMCRVRASDVAHGEELLRSMHDSGLTPTYTVIKCAGAVSSRGKTEYSSDFMLAFKSRHDDEATAIASAVGQDSNFPSVYSSQPILEFDHVYLNVKTFGSQELCVFADEEMEDDENGFSQHDVYRSTKSLKKSLRESQRPLGQFLFVEGALDG